MLLVVMPLLPVDAPLKMKALLHYSEKIHGGVCVDLIYIIGRIPGPMVGLV